MSTRFVCILALVVHLHPGSWEFRLRESRVIAQLLTRLQLEGRAVIALGDFNAHSAQDRARLATRGPLRSHWGRA